MVMRIAAALLVWGLAIAPASIAAAQDAAGEAKSAKKQDKEKKPKQGKKSKKPKSDVPSPDEKVDPDAPETGRVKPVSWKQHPSFRIGNAFRLDVQAKFQEDGRSTYEGGLTHAGLETFELHRNRVGLQGHFFKKIEYEVERELTEKELTDKDISAGVAP